MVLAAVKQHYLATWGEPSRTFSFRHRLHAQAIEVDKWDSRIPDGITVYATIGASASPLSGRDASHRQEFFTGLRPANDAIADGLALLAVSMLIDEAAYGSGQTVTFSEQPLWPGSLIHSWLLMSSSPDVIPPLLVPDGSGLHVQFLSATPIFDAEREFKAQHGADALLAWWRTQHVPFWNPNREPPAGLGE